MNISKYKITNKVLVLGDDARSFLTVIRSLGRKGINVHVGWCSDNCIALKSKYVSQYHCIPKFEHNNYNWISSFKKLLQDEKYDLVIPTNDPSILPLNAYRNEFDDLANIAIPEKKGFHITYDKYETIKLAQKLEIHVPAQILVSDINQIKKTINQLGIPLIIKPISSFSLNELNNKQKVVQANSLSEATGKAKWMLQKGNVVVQKNFNGVGVGLEILANKGQVLCYFQHMRIHEPREGGGSSYRKSVKVNNEILDAGKKIIKELEYTGVAMIEFKMNTASQEWVLIEINGRFWGSLPLAVSAGVDFPYYLYRMIVYGDRFFPNEYRVNVYSRNLTLDFNWYIASLRTGKLKINTILSDMNNIIRFREKSDAFTLDDPLPGIHEVKNLCKLTYNKINHRIKVLFAKTFIFDIYKKKLAYKLRKKIKLSKKVMFVCKGNICRSAFAEIYFNNKMPEIKTVSCGYYHKANRSSPKHAVEAAALLNIDLSNHKSKLITENLIQSVDLIITFDKDNITSICALSPDAKNKIYPLRCMVNDEFLYINDPYNKSLDFFTNTFGIIGSALDNISNSNNHHE